MNLKEELAELEHKQWMSWSNSVANENLNKLPKELIDKWVNNWKPYSKLSEKEKDSDRIWADKVLKLFELWKKEIIEKIKKDNLEILEHGLDVGISSYNELIEQINNNLDKSGGNNLI